MILQRCKYNKPTIKKVLFLCQNDFLTGSVVDKADIIATGQEVVDYDFSEATFTYEW